WGFSKERNLVDENNAIVGAPTAMTGHTTGAWGYGGSRTGCAPCHPGGAGGGYRYFPGDLNWVIVGDTVGGATAGNINPRGLTSPGGHIDDVAAGAPAGETYAEMMVQIGTTRTYGCNQCHDMIGVATNSPAWPHGNRNILAWEWTDFDNIERDRFGRLPRTTWIDSRVESTVTAGNLWMYSASISRVVPGIQIGAAAGANQHPEHDLYGNTLNWQEDLTVADPAFTIVYGVGNSGPNVGRMGEIQDGVCLKCHIPTDPASVADLVRVHNETALTGFEVVAGMNSAAGQVRAADVATRWHQARRNLTDDWSAGIFAGGRNGVRPITNPADPDYGALWNTVERNTGASSKYMFLFR
ncbi:MAG: hypothetical protein FWF11_03925, partial [Coriobacteriia bacterium]|nr:hypothetical protein [Coriobacteriia bacterium]